MGGGAEGAGVSTFSTCRSRECSISSASARSAASSQSREATRTSTAVTRKDFALRLQEMCSHLEWQLNVSPSSLDIAQISSSHPARFRLAQTLSPHGSFSTDAIAVHEPGASGSTSIQSTTPSVPLPRMPQSSKVHPSLHTLPESLHPNSPLSSCYIPSAIVSASHTSSAITPQKPRLMKAHPWR